MMQPSYLWGYITEIRILRRYLHSHDHCNIIYYSQDTGKAQVLLAEKMYTENVKYTYEGIKKEFPQS